MNKRIIEIINLIINQDITLDELEKRFDVSNRTIRNDLNSINDMSATQNIGKIKILSGGMVEKPEKFEKIKKMFQSDDLYLYKLSKDERVSLAICVMINANEFITIAQIAESLCVSRPTIVNDMKDVKEILVTNFLNLQTHKSKGICIDGEERFKRRLLLNIAVKKENANILKYMRLELDESDKIPKIITEQEQKNNLFLADESFKRICMYIQITILRNLQGSFVEKSEDIITENQVFAQDILKYIGQYFKLTLSENDIVLLKYMLHTSSYSKRILIDKNAVKVQFITRKFIDKISESLLVNLRDDYVFFENLSNHLSSVVTENAPEYQESDVVENIVAQNEDVYDIVVQNIGAISNHITREITLIEIQHIVVHICAALERRKNRGVMINAIIACNSGYGTSRLVLEKVKKHFKLNVVDVISSREINQIDTDKVDLIISTVNIPDCKIRQVVISPLLKDEDYMRLSLVIDEVKSSKTLWSTENFDEYSARRFLKDILPVIEKIVPDKAKEIEQEIQKTLNIKLYNDYDIKRDIFSPSLYDLLKAEHIEFNVLCTDWEDSVRKSAQILKDYDYIEETYVQAMVENIEKNGPYIVVSKGVAVPHASPLDGSLKLGMSLIKLETPVDFGAPECDPIKYVCTISPIDKNSHLKAFFHLVNMLQDRDFRKEFDLCQTREKALEVIKRYENLQICLER